MLPKTFLVPTDLGEGAEEALAYACDLAKPLGARIYLVSALATPALAVPELGVAITGGVVDGMMADTRHGLESLAARYAHRGEIATPILRSGDPVEIIHETVKEVGANLIVMTTHGRSGVARWLLGSVAEDVVRTAAVPVLTIRVADGNSDGDADGNAAR